MINFGSSISRDISRREILPSWDLEKWKGSHFFFIKWDLFSKSSLGLSPSPYQDNIVYERPPYWSHTTSPKSYDVPLLSLRMFLTTLHKYSQIIDLGLMPIYCPKVNIATAPVKFCHLKKVSSLETYLLKYLNDLSLPKI